MNYAKELMTSSSFYTLNKALVKKFDFNTAGLLSTLSEAETLCADEYGWFFQTTETIEKLTGMKRKVQTTCLNKLISSGVLLQENKGMPMKRYFKIDYMALHNLLELVQPSMYETDNQGCTECTNYYVQNEQPSLYETDDNKEHIYKQHTSKQLSNKKSSRFTPPSLPEVQDYCYERQNKIDPEAFIDFYEGKGWMVGKNKMKDWKACIRTWERRENGTKKQETPKQQTKNNMMDAISAFARSEE